MELWPLYILLTYSVAVILFPGIGMAMSKLSLRRKLIIPTHTSIRITHAIFAAICLGAIALGFTGVLRPHSGWHGFC